MDWVRLFGLKSLSIKTQHIIPQIVWTGLNNCILYVCDEFYIKCLLDRSELYIRLWEALNVTWLFLLEYSIAQMWLALY